MPSSAACSGIGKTASISGSPCGLTPGGQYTGVPRPIRPDLRQTTAWEEASLIDLEPVVLPAGEMLHYEFDFSGEPDIYWPYYGGVMMYELFEDDRGQPGQTLQTFVQLGQVIPEPSSLSLALTARLSLLGLAGVARCRRRQKAPRPQLAAGKQLAA